MAKTLEALVGDVRDIVGDDNKPYQPRSAQELEPVQSFRVLLVEDPIGARLVTSAISKLSPWTRVDAVDSHDKAIEKLQETGGTEEAYDAIIIFGLLKSRENPVDLVTETQRHSPSTSPIIMTDSIGIKQIRRKHEAELGTLGVYDLIDKGNLKEELERVFPKIAEIKKEQAASATK